MRGSRGRALSRSAPGDPAARAVVRAALGVGVAVGISGLSFGAAAATAGLSVPQSCTLSLLMFTGASQFALVGVLGSGGGVAAGVLGAVLLGTRNTLYAVRLAQLLPLRGARRLLGAHLTIDETTATSTATAPGFAPLAFWSTGLPLYLMWNATTLLGAAGAARLGDPGRLGLDAAVPAAFLALLWPRLRAPAAPRHALGGGRSGGAEATGAVPAVPRHAMGGRRAVAAEADGAAPAASGADPAAPVPGGAVRRTALVGGLLAAAAVPFSPAGVPVLIAALAVLPRLLAREGLR